MYLFLVEGVDWCGGGFVVGVVVDGDWFLFVG